MDKREKKDYQVTAMVDISHLHGIEWKEGHEPIRSHYNEKQIIKEYNLLTDEMMF